MTIKIDLEKAYDHLSWPFIRETLLILGLYAEWVRNIMSCIETQVLSILWIGNNLENFHPSRGIRQGDAICPYLFVLCMGRLGHLIHESVNVGKWKPIKLSRTGPSIFHLFFVDDLILFAEASVD